MKITPELLVLLCQVQNAIEGEPDREVAHDLIDAIEKLNVGNDTIISLRNIVNTAYDEAEAIFKEDMEDAEERAREIEN